MSSFEHTIARRSTAAGTREDTTWFSTMSDRRSNHQRLMAVRMRPLSGIGVGSTQS